MKKMLIVLSLTTLALITPRAQADVFSEYENIGNQLVTTLRQGNANSIVIQSEIEKLVVLGYEIMDLFDNKFPDCAKQFAEMASEDAILKKESFEFLHDRYHDGKGLTPAPSLCYQGRSMVAHPYMAMALIRERADGAADEIEEVATRAKKIKTRLGL